MNFEFIDKCYEVDEHIYDPDILRDELTRQIQVGRRELSPAGVQPANAGRL